MTFDFARHRVILLDILKEIYTDTSIGPFLGFKGGTAAMLFYGLPRASVDLDFDLLDETKKEEVAEKIEIIITKYGEIKEKSMGKRGMRFIISNLAGKRGVKVDVNILSYGSKYEIKKYLGIDMKVMVQEDMFAHKLVAMIERIERQINRDIYDVWYFAKQRWEINRGIVESRSKISFKETLQKATSLLEAYDNKNILKEIGELLSESEKDYCRKKLKSDVIFSLRVMLDSEK
ncbi:MAG: nucleotidyl transferase AbiEii/AbiGii toxin family protein [Methylacidiphilales bacterium]|nr:nucleotidyl transferase AbiEii/AbiGii toxin family protein [Candidatus Methylacidiphilales bacterium]